MRCYFHFFHHLTNDAISGPQELRTMMDEAPLALVFGSEGFGVSEEATTTADGHFNIDFADWPNDNGTWTGNKTGP